MKEPGREKESAKKLPKIIRAAVCVQYVRCGKLRCRCSRGELHGPYHYCFRREGRKLKKVYIRKADVEIVREACETSRRTREQERASMSDWRALLDEIRQMEREECQH